MHAYININSAHILPNYSEYCTETAFQELADIYDENVQHTSKYNNEIIPKFLWIQLEN